MHYKYRLTSEKVNRSQLQYILGISYSQAKREYKTLLDCLDLKRNFLIVQDLIDLKILR